MATDRLCYGTKSCTLAGKILRETADALLLLHNGIEIWFPVSTVLSIHKSVPAYGRLPALQGTLPD